VLRMRKRRSSKFYRQVRRDARSYGLTPPFQPLDLLAIMAARRKLKPRLRPKDMSGEADYGFCMREEDGWLVLYYRPDVSMIGELISQWHEVREAIVMEEERAAGVLGAGKPRHRGGMFNTEHELDIEGWATEMALFGLFGDDAPGAEDAIAGVESPFDSLLEELDS